MKAIRQLSLWLGMTGLWTLAGCGAAEDEMEAVGTSQEEVVISSISLEAAETAVTTVASGKIGITYNENHSARITYNNNSRQISRGASLMGFAQLGLFDGTKITGRVLPPSEWAVLWGDPAITRSRANPDHMYIANLAVPVNKMPSGNIVGSVQTGSPANFCGAYIGGACIARSTTAGRTYTLTNGDCVRRTTTACPFGTFYDGSDLETSPEGRIYAAFADISRNRIDVWMATGPTSPFSRLPDPPAPPIDFTTHPRIKYGPGGLYLIYGSGGSVIMTRYGGGSSFTGTWTPNVIAQTVGSVFRDVSFPELPGTGKVIRFGPELDMDIGQSEQTSMEARIVTVKQTGAGKHYIAISRCTTNTNIACSTAGPAWETSTMLGDQVSPTISVAPDSKIWWVSFLNTNSSVNRTVEVWSGQISMVGRDGASRFRREVAAQRPCPDQRGYWGDYDSMAIGVGSVAYRGYTDSTINTCQRSQFNATPMRASLARWNTTF